jgi:hypothetical protein
MLGVGGEGEDGIRENIKRGESNEMMGTMGGKSWEEGEQRKRERERGGYLLFFFILHIIAKVR